MPFLTTQTEIAAPPADVRKVFLDFDSYSTWTEKHLKKIDVTSGDKENLKPGDKLKITLKGATFPSSVTQNTAEQFSWLGSLPGIFSGEHVFKFQPSQTSPGHTTLVQEETFTGLLSFLVGPTWSMGKQTKAGFEAFNEELKAKVEGKPS